MTTNDQILLNKILTQRHALIAPEMSESDFFEYFVCEQILKDSDLSYEEIDSGVVSGGNDGGIDAFYIFVNGSLISEDTDVSQYKQDVSIRAVIIQTKVSGSFSDLAVSRINTTCSDLLDLNKSPFDFRTVYCEQLLAIAANLQRICLQLAPTFPKLMLDFYYCTKGDSPPAVAENRVQHLQQTIKSLFSDSRFNFEFIGARTLLELTRRSPAQHLPLRFAESPIAPSDESFVCLVRLKDYYQFITTDEGYLRRSMFDANVRDYEGEVEVNREIKATLEQPGQEDFWWLNNGITIVCTKATSAGKTLDLRDAKVVNGLQTSQEIYKFFRNHPNAVDSRNILVRVIVPKGEASRNKIIKATNYQTRIPAASLRATDPIQYDIEQYFEVNNFYYDRRKNYHKNLSRPKDRIISISYLAQAITAILLQEPNNARGRPTSLLKDDVQYSRMFDVRHPVKLYLQCVSILRIVDDYLQASAPAYAMNESINIRFHLAMYAAVVKAGKLKVTPQSIIHIDLSSLDSTFLDSCLNELWAVFTSLRDSEFDGRSDKVAKSKKFDDAVLGSLAVRLGIQQRFVFGPES